MDHTLQDTLTVLNDLSWDQVKSGYVRLVTEYVPGPLSFGYFVPFVLLPSALLVSPERLSHKQIRILFLPVIFASVIHAWYAMGGVDVISVDGLLWSTLLLGFHDVRKDFRRLLAVEHGQAYDSSSRKAVTASTQAAGDADSPIEANSKAKKTSDSIDLVSSSLQHRTEKHEIVHTSEPGVAEQSYPKNLLARLTWVGNLLASTRFHAWTTGSPSRDQRQIRNLRRTPTRIRFVASLIPDLIFVQGVLLPLLVQLALFDPAITSKCSLEASRSSFIPILKSAPPPPSTVVFIQTYTPTIILRPLVHGLWAYSSLSTGWNLPVPLIVLTNYLFGLPADSWSPQNLPVYFGSFSTVLDHGVAGLWGRWWHQHMRVMVSGPGLAVADWLELSEERILREESAQRRSFLYDCRYVLQVVSAFFFSGVTHMGLVPPMSRGAMGLRLRIASFFWLQGLAIIFERLLCLLCDGRKERKQKDAEVQGYFKKIMLRTIRLAWVFGWLCLTLPLLERPFNQLGWWRLWPPPGLPSKLVYYMRGEWIP